MRIGVLFPGQGSQSVGMGREWYMNSRYMQERFEDASVCLGTNVPRLCFGLRKEELNQTIHAQVGIYVVSATLYHLLEKRAGIAPVLLAGHSVGQLAALHAAGSLSFTDGLYLVHKRATLMQAAAQTYAGAMVAVIGLTHEQIVQICLEHDEKDSLEQMAQIAVYNASGQTVISCAQSQMLSVVAAVQRRKGRAIVLPVSGAFHSRHMRDAQKAFQPVLDEVVMRDARIPVVSNICAKPLLTAHELHEELASQIVQPVHWMQGLECFALCDLIIQVGPGKTLANMVRRHWPEKTVLSFTLPRDLNEIARALQA